MFYLGLWVAFIPQYCNGTTVRGREVAWMRNVADDNEGGCPYCRLKQFCVESRASASV